MEVYLYNSTICRLCGEENDNGTLLYSSEENNQNLSEIINTYLPIKVSDDGQLPRTICPGCTIQLEATVEFLNLIINGQKVIRGLYQREKEYKKSLNTSTTNEPEIITEKIIYEINTSDGVYQVEHPIALQVAGLERPKRKRGRPPKKAKTSDDLAVEVVSKEKEVKPTENKSKDAEEPSGKRRRRTPTRFREAVQGKELERIFKEEGVIDGEESESEVRKEAVAEPKAPVSKEPEVIGHMETSGELVVVVKGKGRGRPKGRMRPTREECAICGMEFSCVGRYMSHVAQHGPVVYRCGQCARTFTTRLHFNSHQREHGHSGQTVIPCAASAPAAAAAAAPAAAASSSASAHAAGLPSPEEKVEETTPNNNQEQISPDLASVDKLVNNVQMTTLPEALPDLSVQTTPEKCESKELTLTTSEFLEDVVESKPTENTTMETVTSSSTDVCEVKTEATTENNVDESPVDQVETAQPAGKPKLKCNLCDKLFSNRQSKSLHMKAAHHGERPYVCAQCGASFAYPRSLALHALSHRRTDSSKGFACDLCGKVLNHPSSVVYHKEAQHAGQRYVCNKCGKCFKHKQLLQRHQLVHSQLRPYTCKICNASFKTKANLLNHQLLHSGVKKYSCEICKHRFAHKTSLTLHMRWHTGLKPFACMVCGKRFSQKGNLSEHERIHTGEKPYQCTVCPRRFTTSSQHRLHARRHTADRPYACAHCGKRFGSRNSWVAHSRRAGGGCPGAAGGGAGGGGGGGGGGGAGRGGERPVRCPHCARSFSDSGALNKHKKQMHKQISLLVNDKNQQQQQVQQQQIVQQTQQRKISVLESAPEEMEERVIYVTYDVEDSEPSAFHILDPEQAASLDESKVLTTCELYSGSSLLVQQPQLGQLEQLQQLQLEQLQHEQLEELSEPVIMDNTEHMPVTDEEGNPLHFTMQDGTRLAITSADGKSLQVITKDGQTIPVEINGYADEEEVDNPDTIVHQLNLQKSVDTNGSTPVTHYFTIM